MHAACCADLLGKQLPYGPMLAEHCILRAGLAPARRPASAPLTAEEVAALAVELHTLDVWMDACKDSPPKGYIILKKSPQGVATGDAAPAPKDAGATSPPP